MLQSLSKLYKKYYRQGIHQFVNLLGVAVLLLYPLYQGFTTEYFLGAFIGMLSTSFVSSAYYHRALTHKIWEPNNFMHYFFLTLGAAFWTMPAMYWVAIHRKHHKFADTDKDPHGPKAGWKNNLLMVWSNNPEASYLKRDIKHKQMRWQNDNYMKLALGSTILMSLISPVMYFTAVGYVYVAFILINTLGHFNGISNSHFFALLSGGELYHDTHHKNQTQARLGLFDLGYYGIIKWMK